MGLDMYLEASLYVSGWAHSPEAERKVCHEIVKVAQMPRPCSGAPSLTVSVCVAYWRKANAIHDWFVRTVQGGKDECQKSYVSRDQLQELVAACEKVLGIVETVEGDVNTGKTYHSDGTIEQHTEPGRVVAQAAIAQNVLPTKEGFFFGNTEYDERYLRDLQDTVTMLKPLLADKGLDRCEFYYEASW